MPPVERHLRVHRTARFYVLGEPGGRTKELWVVCHGYGQLAANIVKSLEPFATEERLVVAPEALNRFYLDDPAKFHGPDSRIGASWMTREDRERDIADNVEYLDALTATVCGEIASARVSVVALGFSQGVATVARWAALGKTEVRHLILWGGSLPPDLPKDRGDRLFKGASVALVVGERDAMVTAEAAEKAVATLKDAGIAARLVQFPGGHALSRETLRRLAQDISSGA